MPAFFQVAFAIAGVAAAAGPVVIHLLNRRRFRVVEWAAIDFLRDALQRSRKYLQLRDLLLLIVRTAVVLLFGLALARPYWRHQGTILGGRGPLHAVLVVDNSQSMGYSQLNGTLLDQARRQASDFLSQLPVGSRVSVIPLCGSTTSFTLEPFRSIVEAREALERIEVVDRSASAVQAIELARDACRLAPDLPAKRVVWFTDQQAGNWPSAGLTDLLSQLPELQVVPVVADRPENVWISDFRLQDGIADTESPTTFHATIRYAGRQPLADVQITLDVDGTSVSSRQVNLEPGQALDVPFPYRFDRLVEPGQASDVTATVRLDADSIPSDHLLQDNQRHLVVPVVAALPVVFIDQFGSSEQPSRGQYGETFHFRRLLAPVVSRGEMPRQLIQIRHLTIDEVSAETLRDARLVVMAGITNPAQAVPLLREFVLQGGQLFIAAGANFDPELWNEWAWRDGQGILPAPLAAELRGKSPSETVGTLAPFQLAVNSLVHDYFRLEDVSDEELSDLYQVPLFFKAAVVDVSPPVLAALKSSETARLKTEHDAPNARPARPNLAAQQSLDGVDESPPPQPDWLVWSSPTSDVSPARSLAAQVESQLPQVLARFTNGDQTPAFVERRIGRGLVIFFSSGVFSDWNDLTKTNAALVFDRILRMQLQSTLPRRNLQSVEQFTLPVESADRRIQYQVTRPDGAQETLTVDAIGRDTQGITLRNIVRSGHYVLTAARQDTTLTTASTATTDAEPKTIWTIPLSVNSPERESDLSPVDQAALRDQLRTANVRLLNIGEPISLEGAQVSLQNLWKWLMGLVLAGLIAELVILAWPQLKAGGRR